MHTGPVLVPLLDPVSLAASVVEPVVLVLASVVEPVDEPSVVEPPVVGVAVLVPAGPVLVTGAPELPVSLSGSSREHATNSKIGAR
jgi:hypothetical protein